MKKASAPKPDLAFLKPGIRKHAAACHRVKQPPHLMFWGLFPELARRWRRYDPHFEPEGGEYRALGCGHLGRHKGSSPAGWVTKRWFCILIKTNKFIAE
jgi:hypothetical protein